MLFLAFLYTCAPPIAGTPLYSTSSIKSTCLARIHPSLHPPHALHIHPILCIVHLLACIVNLAYTTYKTHSCPEATPRLQTSRILDWCLGVYSLETQPPNRPPSFIPALAPTSSPWLPSLATFPGLGETLPADLASAGRHHFLLRTYPTLFFWNRRRHSHDKKKSLLLCLLQTKTIIYFGKNLSVLSSDIFWLIPTTTLQNLQLYWIIFYAKQVKSLFF